MLSARIAALVVILLIILTGIFTTQRRQIRAGFKHATTSVHTHYHDKLGHSSSEINILNSLHPIGKADSMQISDANDSSTQPANLLSTQSPPLADSPPVVSNTPHKPNPSMLAKPLYSGSLSDIVKLKPRPKLKPMLPNQELAVSINSAQPSSPASSPVTQDKTSSTNYDPRPQSPIYQSFYEIGVKHKSDKVNPHMYQRMYTKHLESMRLKPLRFLEIGLDCHRTRGPGPSYKLWLEYLPNVQLYFIEADAACATIWSPSTHRATIFTGDAANTTFLQTIVAESGGEFDVIVDDGGHTMEEQRVSFETLMPSLKKGGTYFVEDLQTSFEEGTYGGGVGVWGTFVERIKVGLDGLLLGKKKGVWTLVESLDCMKEICAFTRE